ncbi:MAG: ATP-binding protein [Chloroflexota bacterium]
MLTLTMKQETTQADFGQFYHYLGQHLAAGLFVVDGQDRITFANRAAEQLLGYKSGLLTGCAYDLVQPQAAVADIVPGDLWETTLRHQDGRFISVRLSMIPLPLSHENGRLITIFDMHHVEQFTQALIHTQRLAAVGTMTSSVAHEITNPLSIITNTCSNLYHELQNDDLNLNQLRRYIEMVEQSAWRCVRIVETLRNYTYDGEASMAVTDLNMVATESLQLIEQQFLKEFNVTIDMLLDPALKSIVCDHDRIIQVVINLLINARNAMQPQGGTICLKTWSLVEASDLATNGTADKAGTKTYYALSVCDRGHGIKPHLLSHIFEPFFTTRPNGAGSGLGLFVAREIIKQHNGRIWAENNPDGGATFTVLLPQRQ